MPRRGPNGYGHPLRALILAMLSIGGLLFPTNQARADDAQDCEHSQNWTLVVQACSAVIAREPSSEAVAWAYNKRGIAQDHLGKGEIALKDYSSAISADRDFVEAYVNRGAKLSHEAFLAYITYDRDRASAYYALAEHDFSRALDIDWRNVRAYFERGKMHLDKAHDNSGETQELDSAIADLTRALDLDPQYGPAYRKRGIANQTRGHNDQAIADYTHAIGVYPDDALLYHFRGEAYVDRATESGLSESYLENGPDKADISRAIKADLDHAIADYDRALALNPKEDVKKERDRAVKFRARFTGVKPRDL